MELNITNQKYNSIAPKGRFQKEVINNLPLVQYIGQYEALTESVILAKDIKSAYDGWAKYYINKDGSVRKLTALGAQEFPSGSCSSLVDLIKKDSKNKSEIFSAKKSKKLIAKVEKALSEIK